MGFKVQLETRRLKMRLIFFVDMFANEKQLARKV